MSVHCFAADGTERCVDTLAPLADSLRSKRDWLAGVPVDRLLALFDEFGGRLLRDPRTAGLEGAMFLSAWLGRRNLQPLVELNLNGNASYLDGFVAHGRNYLAAKPHGLVAMWMPGNVATLPMFSLVPALLAKNVCLVKLALPDPSGMDHLLAVLAQCEVEGLRGSDLLEAVAVVWFDYRNQRAQRGNVAGGRRQTDLGRRRGRPGHLALAPPRTLRGTRLWPQILDRTHWPQAAGGRCRPGLRRGLVRARYGHLRSAGLLGAANDLHRA